MSKIKICGLSRPQDIDYVNEAQPDFCGFIVNVPKSRRNVSPDTLRSLRKSLRPEVLPVGVFVNEDPETIVSLVLDGTLALVQLHGQEDEAYIAALREKISVPIIKAFRVDTRQDVENAQTSSADYILLDNGSGGTGQVFDWSLLQSAARPYILAGGLGPDNLASAVQALHPFAVDLSSGVETDGFKDREKILAAVRAVRETV
jgi:phosphoribosylanthranilate isomerase